MKRPRIDDHGFTLIEVIVTIIVSAILAVLLMQVMSGHITRSYWTLNKMDEGLALGEVMEIINADYRRLIAEDPEPLEKLQEKLGDGDYWSGLPYGADINLDRNHCIYLDKSGETGGHTCSHPEDRILKVTLSYQEQSLTALFSR